MHPAFRRHVGIDYSGARAADDGLPGLRAYVAGPRGPAVEARPHRDPRRNWSRRALATWLADLLADGVPTIVGIDHGFSLPRDAFARNGLPGDWPAFLEAFAARWPTDQPGVTVDDVRATRGSLGPARERRATEVRAGAKSVFHFDVPGSVAKSTHAGLPWLRFLRARLGAGLHCWPFDGWAIPAGKSALVEAYPSLWNRGFPRDDRTPDQHDAWTVATWLRRADGDGTLATCLLPPAVDTDRAAAATEGWILGVR